MRNAMAIGVFDIGVFDIGVFDGYRRLSTTSAMRNASEMLGPERACCGPVCGVKCGARPAEEMLRESQTRETHMTHSRRQSPCGVGPRF